jgi:hypothetical protein
MGWLTGYTYRKLVTVTNESADYQTWVLVGKTSDAIGEDVDCDGKCLDNMYDVRWTDANGTELKFWRESVVDSGGTKLGKFAVKNTAVPDTTLYMYYGNAGASDASNGANTFIQFEDFEWGSNGDPLDDNGGSVTWTIDLGTIDDISTVQKFGGTRAARLGGNGAAGARITTPVTASDNIAIRFRLYKETAVDRFNFAHGDGTNLLYAFIGLSAAENIMWFDGASNQDTGADITPDDWELIELSNFVWAAPTVDIYLNDANISDDTDISYLTATYGDQVMFNTADVNSSRDCWIDDVIVRKWAATEPSFAFGGEETESAWIPKTAFIM